MKIIALTIFFGLSFTPVHAASPSEKIDLRNSIQTIRDLAHGSMSIFAEQQVVPGLALFDDKQFIEFTVNGLSLKPPMGEIRNIWVEIKPAFRGNLARLVNPDKINGVSLHDGYILSHEPLAVYRFEGKYPIGLIVIDEYVSRLTRFPNPNEPQGTPGKVRLFTLDPDGLFQFFKQKIINHGVSPFDSKEVKDIRDREAVRRTRN